MTTVRHEHENDTMNWFSCVTAQPMREIKAPRDRLTGAGRKSPSAAEVKSLGREHRRKRSGYTSDQIGDREMNESEPRKPCRNSTEEVKTRSALFTWDQHGRSLFRAVRPPALRWHDSVTRRLSGTWEPSAPMLTERLKQMPCESLSRDAVRRGGMIRSSDEIPDKGIERRGHVNGGWIMEPTNSGRSS